MVVPDPLKAPDEVSHRRVECLDDPFGRGYGSKAYYNVQECSIHHGVTTATRRKCRVSPLAAGHSGGLSWCAAGAAPAVSPAWPPAGDAGGWCSRRVA